MNINSPIPPRTEVRKTVVIKVKIDKETPTAAVTYNHVSASGGKKDYVEASVTLTDNVSDSTNITLLKA